MQRQPLKSSRLRSAGYDEAQRRLELEFQDRSIRIYKGVPPEVWRRLSSAPDAAVYFDDRIAEEYPWERGSPAPADDARERLDDLFKS